MMKKYIAAAVLSITVLGALAGCGSSGNVQNGIGAGSTGSAGSTADTANTGSAENVENTKNGTVNGSNGSGSGTAAGGSDIGSDAALNAALNDAGVAEGDISRLRVTEDRDDGRKVYEVRFNVADKEYDYEIHAADGTILSADVERDDDYQAQQNGNGNSGTANVAVSLEEATQIALDKVPGATESDIRIKLDYDDGRQKYEGDVIYQQTEYDFEIDADTGEVIEWSEERA